MAMLTVSLLTLVSVILMSVRWFIARVTAIFGTLSRRLCDGSCLHLPSVRRFVRYARVLAVDRLLFRPMSRNVTADSALGGSSLKEFDDRPNAGGSRPSKTNPSDPTDAGESASDRLDKRGTWWRRKNKLVEQFTNESPDRAIRPISVRDGTKLREDAASERHDDGYRSRSWSQVLREFLGWYNGYRYSHLCFRSPDGDLVRAPMPNSHQPAYGNKYYARTKGLERQIMKEYADPHLVMLTLTGSHRNAKGGWRCPADHLRDVVDPFGDKVRPALHRALSDVGAWEYAKVLEHHQSGYGHMHVAVFIDGAVTESDFHPVIDAHLRHCDIAGVDAHDYHDPDQSIISLRRIDPEFSLDELEEEEGGANAHDVETVGNLGSYLAEYIGSHGEELFDRSMSELTFRAACWATGSQRVTFSNGAQEFISADLDDGGADPTDLPDAPARYKPGVTPEDIEAAASDPDANVSDYLEEDQDWSLEGIGVVDEDGEDRYDVENTGVTWIDIDDASHLDPPSVQPTATPVPRSSKSSLDSFR